MATDVRSLGASPAGLVSCSALVNAGIAGGGEFLFQNGTFLLDESIKIPSNTTIYIKNAKIRMADASYDNFFRNSDFTGGNENVKIIGLGNAVLDGNSANNDDDYATYGGTNQADSYKYMGIMFSGVNGFEISGLKMVDNAHYAILIHKSFGSVGNEAIIKDIYLNYYTLTANQDGIDYAWGCHDINVSNCRGYTADDWRIFAAGVTGDFIPRITNWNVGDIYNMTATDDFIFNAKNGSLCALICGEGNKVHDIDISDAKIVSGGSVMFSSYGATFEGDPPIKDDLYNITMDNILVTAITGWVYPNLFSIGESCKDITITNLTNNSGKTLYVEGEDLDVENFTINGAQQSA